MNRDPRHMEYDEIVQEIHGLKAEMERTSARIVELAAALYSNIRRGTTDEYSSRYLSFANTWTRLGQMVEVSLQRTLTSSRLVETVARDKKASEAEQQQQERKARQAAKKKPPATPQTDLAELYGEEMVTNAAR